jgi:hypothetical protein
MEKVTGIEIKIDPKSYPNGRFTRLYDPEGIRSNCGNLQDQTLYARLLSSSGLFLDYAPTRRMGRI